MQTCHGNGRWSGCEGAIGPGPEICGDGIDNDCDGEIDQGCSCVPVAEICNDGIDNDCDGEIDELACTPDWMNPVELSAGGHFTCVRRASGTVTCWGELDDYIGLAAVPPTDVEGLNGVLEIAIGGSHACARRAESVVCWGRNFDGQLGDGTTVSHATPVVVLGLTDAVEIAAGSSHTCARRASGRVVCWGRNLSGQLGDGTTVNRATPTEVIGLTDAVEIITGTRHTCARRSAGPVVCWGEGKTGPLLERRFYPLPREVELRDSVQLATGCGSLICVRQSSGAVVCREHGEESSLTEISGLDNSIDLIAGCWHFCARSASSTSCWGLNSSGQLGNGSFGGNSSEPLPVSSPDAADIIGISAGHYHTCALRASGAVVCWGENSRRQLGDGTIENRSTPTEVVGL